MKKVLLAILMLPVLAVAYLLIKPSPIDPINWTPPQTLGYINEFATNDRLSGYQGIELAGLQGPETMVLGPDGLVYAALLTGEIVRFDPSLPQPEVWAKVSGRILGFDFHPDGRLIAADAVQGLISIDRNGHQQVLISADSNASFAYLNAVAVNAAGDIYFTNSSRRYSAMEAGDTFASSSLVIMEHRSTGELFSWTAQAQDAGQPPELMLNDLCFANGVALDGAGFVYLNETCEYRIWQIDPATRGQSAKSIIANGGDLAKPLFENLPGFPDNLTQGINGKIWVGLVKPRSPVVDKLANKAWVRAAMFNMPQSMAPIPPYYGHVFAFNSAGEIVENLQDPSRRYPETTGVTETEYGLFIQSLTAKEIAWVK